MIENVSTAFVGFQLPGSVRLTGYRLSPSGLVGHSPSRWTLLCGHSPSGPWVVLDAEAGITWRLQSHFFSLSTASACSVLALNVTASTAGGTSAVTIVGWEIFGDSVLQPVVHGGGASLTLAIVVAVLVALCVVLVIAIAARWYVHREHRGRVLVPSSPMSQAQ